MEKLRAGKAALTRDFQRHNRVFGLTLFFVQRRHLSCDRTENQHEKRLMLLYDKIILRIKLVIETINGKLKNVVQAAQKKKVFSLCILLTYLYLCRR